MEKYTIYTFTRDTSTFCENQELTLELARQFIGMHVVKITVSNGVAVHQSSSTLEALKNPPLKAISEKFAIGEVEISSRSTWIAMFFGILTNFK